MAGGVPRALRSMSADQIAKRCQELGARTEIRGAKWWIYPPDRDQAPLSFSRLAGHMSGNGTAQANLISDLRKAGLDLLAEARAEQNAKPTPTSPPSPAPSPAPSTEEHAAMTVNGTVPYTVDGTSKPFDYRKAYTDLRDQAKVLDAATTTALRDIHDHVKRQDGALVAMVAEQEGRITDNAREQDERIRALAARIKVLEQLLARGEVTVTAPAAPKAPEPPSKPEVVRRAVLAFFTAHRGLKLSPMAVRANIEDDPVAPLAPEGMPVGVAKDQTVGDMLAIMPATTVAASCRTLADAKTLMGGGKTGGPLNPNHGVYWMPAETAPKPTDATGAGKPAAKTKGK